MKKFLIDNFIFYALIYLLKNFYPRQILNPLRFQNSASKVAEFQLHDPTPGYLEKFILYFAQN